MDVEVEVEDIGRGKNCGKLVENIVNCEKLAIKSFKNRRNGFKNLSLSRKGNERKLAYHNKQHNLARNPVNQTQNK